MTFETLASIGRLKQAGVDETTARAHAEALRIALGETVATKDGLTRETTRLEHKFELALHDQTIKVSLALGAACVALLSAMTGLKLFAS